MLRDSIRRSLGLVGQASCLLAPCASAQNLVANPDFETYVGSQPSDWLNTGASTRGNVDLLWYNASSGKIVRWLMDANVQRITGDFTTPSNAGNNNWKVVAAGEYKRLGTTDGVDLVWRNETSGKLVEWLLDASGTRVQGAFTAPDSPSPPLGWTVVGPR